MTLRAGKRRNSDRGRAGLRGFLEWLRAFAVLLVGLVAAAASASAQEALVLFKTPAKEGGVDLIVRGARPGEDVWLVVDARPDPDPARGRVFALVADPSGIARLPVPASEIAAAGGDLFAQAGTSDLRSNVIPLREVPALYLLVDEAGASARVVRFDPTRGTLDPQLVRLDADSVLSFGRFLPVAARDGSLVRSGQDASPLAGAPLNSGERLLDLVSSVDQSMSMLLALTREDLPQGRAVIRLRLIETNPDTHEIASIEIQRGGGRLVSAWLVSDVDSRRALIAERDGTIREVVLGAEPGRGVTILPLTPQTSEELLKVAIHGDQVVVVTHPGPLRSRNIATSRMLVFDLNERGDPVETTLDSVALGFEVAERSDGPAAFITLESGQVEVVPLDPRQPTVTIPIPDVRRIARGPDGNLFTLQQGGVAAVSRIDAETLAVDPVPLLGLSSRATRFGVFGGLVDRVRRTWLYVVQRQPGTDASDEELLCAELDPGDGHAIGAVPVPLGGRVRRVANR
jgi:hypothetical protein